MKNVKRIILATIVGVTLTVPAIPTFAANQNGTKQNGICQNSYPIYDVNGNFIGCAKQNG